MNRSFFSRIFGGYVVIITVVAILLLVLTFSTVKRSYVASRTDELKNVATVLQGRIIALVEKNDRAGLNKLLKETEALVRMRLTVIRPDGRVIADSEVAAAQLGDHRDRPEVRIAFTGRTGVIERYSGSVHKKMLYVAEPIVRNGTVRAILRASFYVEPMEQVLREMELHSVFLSVLLIGAALLFSLFIVRRITAPLRSLTETVRDIAAGDLSARVPLSADVEMRTFALSFNHMADEVKRLFSEISLQKEELQTIISAMQEALVVIGADGIIQLSNESFSRLVGEKTGVPVPYWQVIRSDELSTCVKQVLEEGKSLSREVQLGQRTVLVSATRLPQGSACILLWDITESKDLERIKKDFVTNVSHELRTPLTAIKGFVETLQPDIAPEHRSYLDIIAAHTDRLIAIVQDLLLLSELTEKSSEMVMQNVPVLELLEKVRTLFTDRLQKKGLVLTVRSDVQSPLLRGDAFKLEQVFINLIDNAIKYSEKGTIAVTVSTHGSDTVISIADEGIGIPEEALPRIFERFYVVDRSRSRKAGGTGLGLSIVKHIVHLHNGRIEVSSAVGRGTTFTLVFPGNAR